MPTFSVYSRSCMLKPLHHDWLQIPLVVLRIISNLTGFEAATLENCLGFQSKTQNIQIFILNEIFFNSDALKLNFFQLNSEIYKRNL